MGKRWTRARVAAWVAIAVVLTASALLLILNMSGPEQHVARELAHHAAVGSPQLRRELDSLLGPPIVDGNRIENLENGDEIFPAMLDAIARAERSITLETFIYWSGTIGQRFADVLSERARAGVAVHVLLDWVGSDRIEERLVERMRSAGVEARYYRPLRWYHLARMNHRTHRKLLIVDGRVGFTGGVGIADVWLGHAQDPEHWRDSHYRVEGPVVAQLQAAFADHWTKTTGGVLFGEAYFPPLSAAGEISAQVFRSSPSGGIDSMQLMYLLAVSAATESIDLAAAYFVPGETMRRALTDAIQRGVRVRVIVPGAHIDQDIVRHASRADWGKLLTAGVEIYEFLPTMFHVKAMVADRQLVSVGSTNFDNRSFRLNEECNLNVYDRGLAERVTRVFEGDLRRSRRVTLEAWRRRPWHERLLDELASVLAPQL